MERLETKGLKNIVNSEKLEDLPMVLETPSDNRDSYKENIEKIKELRD